MHPLSFCAIRIGVLVPREELLLMERKELINKLNAISTNLRPLIDFTNQEPSN